MTSPRPTLETGALDGSEEPTVLGASPTLQGGRKARRQARKARRTDGAPTQPAGSTSASTKRSGSGSPLKGVLLAALAILLFALAPTVTSAFKRSPADRIGVSYSGGPISGVQFQRVVEPGEGLFFNGFFSNLYLYPAGVSTYEIPNREAGAGFLEAERIVVPSSDRVPVTVELTINYRLNRDLLQGFHESLGLEHEATTPEGWDSMERIVIRAALAGAAEGAMRNHSAEELDSDPEVLATLQTEIAEGTAHHILESTGDRYFCAPDHEPGQPCAAPRVIVSSMDIPEWARPGAEAPGGADQGGD